MPKIKILDKKGNEKKELELNARLFGAVVNPVLMAQAVRVRLINAQLGMRKTQSRSETAGGGRKPWRQKGTGRARHGSIRSPIWVGGGHAHALKSIARWAVLPKKQRRLALFSALTQKLESGQLIVMDDFKLEEIKTRKLKNILDVLQVKGKTLIIMPKKNQTIEKSAKNLPQVKTLEARLLNAMDILRFTNVLILQDSLKVLDETFT